VILIDPATYRRQPWKNGLGVSEEIAAERDGEGEWAGLVWSFSRTSFDRPLAFSDLAGIDRIITVVEGSGLSLRARDGGADIVVPPLTPTAFDGGRALEGVPDGPVRVVNVMGRRGRVRIQAAVVRPGEARSIDAAIVLAHAAWGEAVLGKAVLPAGWTVRGDGGAPVPPWSGSAILLATVARSAQDYTLRQQG
jgi:hypothetical protein